MKKCLNRLIFHTFCLVICKLMRIRIQFITLMRIRTSFSLWCWCGSCLLLWCGCKRIHNTGSWGQLCYLQYFGTVPKNLEVILSHTYRTAIINFLLLCSRYRKRIKLTFFLFDQVKKMGILTANMQKQIGQKKPSGGGTILNNFSLYISGAQCWGSVTFWCGSASAGIRTSF
jgi:hypothetical protein